METKDTHPRFIAERWIHSLEGLTAAEAALLYQLASYCSREHGFTVWPNRETLGKRTRLHITTISKALAQLKKREIVSIQYLQAHKWRLFLNVNNRAQPASSETQENSIGGSTPPQEWPHATSEVAPRHQISLKGSDIDNSLTVDTANSQANQHSQAEGSQREDYREEDNSKGTKRKHGPRKPSGLECLVDVGPTQEWLDLVANETPHHIPGLLTTGELASRIRNLADNLKIPAFVTDCYPVELDVFRAVANHLRAVVSDTNPRRGSPKARVSLWHRLGRLCFPNEPAFEQQKDLSAVELAALMQLYEIWGKNAPLILGWTFFNWDWLQYELGDIAPTTPNQPGSLIAYAGELGSLWWEKIEPFHEAA